MILLSMNTGGKHPNHFASQLSLESVDSGKRTLKDFLFFQIYKLGFLSSDTKYIARFFWCCVFFLFFFLLLNSALTCKSLLINQCLMKKHAQMGN